jgi:uncharacterized membrane protein (DUF485 family)
VFEKLLKPLFDYMENASVQRFNRWTAFLNRKMFFCLIMAMTVTVAYMAMTLLSLWLGGVAAMQALGTGLWTEYCITIGSITGIAVGGNVMEHREKTRQRVPVDKAGGEKENA